MVLGADPIWLYLITKSILEEKPIDVFNNGKHTRDFTYIDDIVDGIIKTINNPPKINDNWNSDKPDPSSSKALGESIILEIIILFN